MDTVDLRKMVTFQDNTFKKTFNFTDMYLYFIIMRKYVCKNSVDIVFMRSTYSGLKQK